MKAIGQIKTKTHVYCNICGCKMTRTFKENIFENTEESKNEAINKIKNKIASQHTCCTCVSIIKSL